MSIYRIQITTINGQAPPAYPTEFVSSINAVSLSWQYTSGDPPLPTSISALEIIASDVQSGLVERVRLGAPNLTVGEIAGLALNKVYNVHVVAYDINNDILAFSRPVRVRVSSSANTGIAIFHVLRIQRTLNYIDENYIQVTTNSPSESINIVWGSVNNAAIYRLWYGIASSGEFIDTNQPQRQTLSSTDTTIRPDHTTGSKLYVLKLKAFNANGNEIATTRTYAFYWTIVDPNQPPPQCSYQAYDVTAAQIITSTTHTIVLSSLAGVRTIRIIASCPFSIVFTGNGWARLSNAFYDFTAGYDGNEDFPIYYDENSTSQSREATLVIRNAANSTIFTITLRQNSSSSAPPCSYTITTNPPYNSVRQSDGAFVIIVSADTTSVQVTVNTSSTCRYYFLDQFFQFSGISGCRSACSGTNTVTLSFPENNSTNAIEREVKIIDLNRNSLIRTVVVRQLPYSIRYPLPDFVSPPTPISGTTYLLDQNSRYRVFVRHNGDERHSRIILRSDAFGTDYLIVDGRKKAEITIDFSFGSARFHGLRWMLTDLRNTRPVFNTRVFYAHYDSRYQRATLTRPLPAERTIFVPPNSGVSVTFEWNTVDWARWYRLYMFSDDVLIAYTPFQSTNTLTYNFTRAELDSLPNGELYVELEAYSYITDQIVLRFENLPPPPPPPPPPEDETKILDVVEHVFEGQVLTSGDVARSGFELRIWEVCGDAHADVVRTSVKSWRTADERELRVITEAPEIEHTVSRSILRNEVEFPSATLRFTELFPFEKVFARFLAGESKRPLMYYARLTCRTGDEIFSVCEGIIRMPIDTTLLRYTHATNQGDVRQVMPFSVQLFHPASLLKFTNPIDQTSRTITYNRASSRLESSGKGVIDYIRNAFDAGIFVRIIDVLDVIGAWLNEASIFARAGIFDSVRDTSGNPMYYPTVEVQGFDAFMLLRNENSERKARYEAKDLLFSYIYLDSFIHSDSYGDPKSKQKSGELRDYSVEITRGLKGNDNKYPKEEKEFSLLNSSSVLDFVIKLTESCLCSVFFSVKRVSNTYRVFMILSRQGVSQYTGVYYRNSGALQAFYLARKEALFAENPHKQDIATENLLFEFIRVSEINGAGNEREDRKLPRTELNDLLVYDASKTDAVNALFGAIRYEQRLSVASAYALTYEFVSGVPDVIVRKLTLPSDRALEQHEREFYVRTALQNVRAATSWLIYQQINQDFEVRFHAPTWFVVLDDKNILEGTQARTGRAFVGRYLAEAIYQFLLSRIKQSIKTISLRAKLPSAHEFAEHYTLGLGQVRVFGLASNALLRVRHYRYDVVRDEIEGEFEVVTAQQIERDSELSRPCELVIQYDLPPPSESSYRSRYTIPIRRAGLSYPSGSSVYGDAWKGYRLLWSVDSEYEDYSIVVYRYRDNVLRYIHEVSLPVRLATTGLEFGLPNYNLINTVSGRYVLVLVATRAQGGIRFANRQYVVLDVDYGFLNVSYPHDLIHGIDDLRQSPAVRVKFSFAWFATKKQTIVIMSSAPRFGIGEALCVFVRDGHLHVARIGRAFNAFQYSGMGSCDLSRLPSGSGVYDKISVEIDIDNLHNAASFKVNGTLHSTVPYAYADDDFNLSEYSMLALDSTFFNVAADNEGGFGKVHGEFIEIWTGNSLDSLTKQFERYFDNEIGKVIISDNESGVSRVFVDEGKNMAKF
jgi:hypothetical protein